MDKSWIFSEQVVFKSENDESFVEGVISSSSPDLINEIISERALRQFESAINDSHSAGKPIPLGYDHTEMLGGRLNLVPLGHFVKAWFESGKVYAKATLNKALSVYNEVKSALERKDLHSFSVEYVPESKSPVFINGVKHMVVNSLRAVGGVALTGRPLNGEAMLTAFSAKNLDFSKIGSPVIFEEKKTVTSSEENKMKTETESQVKKFEVSEEEYAQLADLKSRKEEEKSAGKFKEVALKIIQDEMAKMPRPSFGGTQKFDAVSQTEQPEAVKDWMASIENKSMDWKDRYHAAGKFHTFLETKGRSPGTPSNRGLKNWSLKFDQHKRGYEMKGAFDLKAQIEHDTNRTTTGTEYFLAGPDLNDIYNPAITSHLNELHTAYGILRKVDGSDYGDTYGFRFKYARNTDTANYDESGTDNPTAATTSRKKAHIPFMWYRKVGQVSNQAIAAASGRGGIGDLYSTEVADQTEALLQAINVDIFDSTSPSDGMTRGGQILSLRYLCDDATTHTTLYSHTRTSGNFTTLQGTLTAKTGSPNPGKDDLRTMWTTSVANGAQKDDLMFLTSFTQLRKLLGTLDDGQRYMGNNANAGFVGQFSLDGVPVFPDASCDAGFIYLIDTRYTYLVVQLPPTIDELDRLGDYRKFQIKSYFLLVGEAPNHNYLMTGFNTS